MHLQWSFVIHVPSNASLVDGFSATEMLSFLPALPSLGLHSFIVFIGYRIANFSPDSLCLSRIVVVIRQI